MKNYALCNSVFLCLCVEKKYLAQRYKETEIHRIFYPKRSYKDSLYIQFCFYIVKNQCNKIFIVSMQND